MGQCGRSRLVVHHCVRAHLRKDPHLMRIRTAGQLAVAAALMASTFTGAGSVGALSSEQVSAAAAPAACASFENASVFRLYRAYFLRDPDTGGHAYWEDVITSGRLNLAGVSRMFADSPEFADRYNVLDDRAFVALVYTNVMNRTPDAGGHDYWTYLLGAGTFGRGDVMVSFSESFEFRDLVGILPAPPAADAPQVLPDRVPVTLKSGHSMEELHPPHDDWTRVAVSRTYPDTADLADIAQHTRDQMQCAGWTVVADGPTVINSWQFSVQGPNGLRLSLDTSTGFATQHDVHIVWMTAAYADYYDG
jgi:hypothetical protein